MIDFNADTGFSVTETSDLRDEIATEWQNAFKENGKPLLNTDPETPQGQIIDSQVAAVSQKDAEVLYLAQQFDPRTAEGRFQDALAKIYFLTRKPAINSSAVCTLTGRAGTQIGAGALIQSTIDDTQWALNEDATITGNGTVQASFTCLTDGEVSAAQDTLTKIVTAVTGWDSVTNATATLGQLEESQAAFEARRYNSVALNSRGTTGSVYARVANVDNVIATYVTDNKTNVNKTVDGVTLKPHSLFCAVLGGNDSDIADAIYHSLSAGCDYNGNTSVNVTDEYTGAVETVTFTRPSTLRLYAKITIQNDGNLPNDYVSVIKNAVYNNFYGNDTETKINNESLLRVVMNTDLYASRFTPSILNAGIPQVLRVELSTDNATWTDFVHISIDKEPTLLLTDISVVEQ
jgi:hypothetical protein